MAKLGTLIMHRGVFLVSAGWISFITENLVLSHNRDYIISEFGSKAYHQAYSILSTLSCGAIAYSYYRHCRGQLRFSKVYSIRHPAAFILQAIGLIGLSQLAPKLQNPFLLPGVNLRNDDSQFEESEDIASLPKVYGVTLRCPIDFKASKQQKEDVSGIERVCRHPVLWSLAAVSLGSAVATPFAAEAVALSFPILWAVIGGAHKNYRHRIGSGGHLGPQREAATSFWPFAALLTGRQSWTRLGEELKWTNAQLAVAAVAALSVRRLLR